MFKIAFCDDNTSFLENIKDFTSEYLKNRQINAELCTYNLSTTFVEQFESKPFYFDIVFLDIDMPMVDGIQIAEHIRASNKEIIVIFLTCQEERVYETFKFNTFRFIRKNFAYIELEECLEKSIRLLKNDAMQYTFKTTEGLVKLYAKDIMYFNYIDRRVEVHTANHCYMTKINRLKDVLEIFKERDFMSIHRGCLVNMKYIKAIGTLYIELDNGEKLSVSRYKRHEIFQVFASYVM